MHPVGAGLLLLALVLFFTPHLVLPFFNHPFTDDYFCGYHLDKYGFSGYQSFVYTACGGRFAATFTGALFAYNHFLFDHYYLHSILLLFLNTGTAILLLHTLNRQLLQSYYSNSKVIIAGLVFTALLISCIPQQSTFLYWFSSAITYSTGIALFQLLLAAMITLTNTGNKTIKGLCYAFIPVLIILLNGFNELFIVSNALLLCAYLYFTRNNKKHLLFLVIVIALFAASAWLVISAPGNDVRASRIVPKGLITGVAATGFETLLVFWNIFKTPLFWLSLITVCHMGSRLPVENNAMAAIRQLAEKKWLMPVLILSSIIAMIGVAVYGLKGGVIPDRYLNGVSIFTVMLLLLYAFIIGLFYKPFTSVTATMPDNAHTIIAITFAVGLLCTTVFADACQSLIAAPIYDSILTERTAALKTTANNHATAVLQDYNTALQQHIGKDYAGSSKTLVDMVQQKPTLLFFEDDLATDYSINMLKSFYRVDSIAVLRK